MQPNEGKLVIVDVVKRDESFQFEYTIKVSIADVGTVSAKTDGMSKQTSVPSQLTPVTLST